MAVWWVWIYTSWVTNWLDPERTPVRLALFAIMLAGLVLSTCHSRGFRRVGPPLRAAHASIQVGRTLFTLWAVGGHAPSPSISAASWPGSASPALLDPGRTRGGRDRLALWIVALASNIWGRRMGFWTPGLGRSTTADWDVEGGHMAERCGLFVIIALGESILVTGATFSSLAWTCPWCWPSCRHS